MNIRCFLSAILVGVFIVFCSPADDLSQAPLPHVKKTKAELLVGKWKRVEKDGRPIPKTGKYYLEFTADGKLHISSEDHLFPLKVVSGTYKLIGDTLHFHTPVDGERKEQKWEVKIESITDEALALTAKRDNFSTVHRYRRVASEK